MTSLIRNNHDYFFICRKPKSSIEVRQKTQHDPQSFSRKPCAHTNVEKTNAKEAENDEFLEVIRSFNPYDRVKVQMCSRVNQGVLSPTVQLFEIANRIFACVEHRNSPTTCFANTELKRPKDTPIYDVETYVEVWKPVLMMEIVTSAVHEGDVVILSNLLVSFAQDFQGKWDNCVESLTNFKIDCDADDHYSWEDVTICHDRDDIK